MSGSGLENLDVSIVQLLQFNGNGESSGAGTNDAYVSIFFWWWVGMFNSRGQVVADALVGELVYILTHQMVVFAFQVTIKGSFGVSCTEREDGHDGRRDTNLSGLSLRGVVWWDIDKSQRQAESSP